MTESNNEWVPEVGAECEADDKDCPTGVFRGVITAEGRNHYLVANDSWEIPFHKHKVRPIKTEAEKRREERIDLLAGQIWQLTPALKIESAKILASNLVADNWIKPKPLTDGLIGRLYHADTKIFVSRIDAYIRGELEL